MIIYIDNDDNIHIKHETTSERMELKCLTQDYKDSGVKVINMSNHLMIEKSPGNSGLSNQLLNFSIGFNTSVN